VCKILIFWCSPGDTRQVTQHINSEFLKITILAGLSPLLKGGRKRVGREMRMLVENSDDHTAADPSLLRIIARAHDIQARLIQNTKLIVHDIAREERVSAAYIYNLLRLPWLAPDITTAIVNGRQPQQLNAKTLMQQASQLPTDWVEQRTRLGFR
jgi:site-specific DNA recombinase